MPDTLNKPKFTQYRESPWVFVYDSLLGVFFIDGYLGGYASAQLGLVAILPTALGCFIAGSIYYQWRLRHPDDLPVDRWGYFPPENLGANKL